MRDLVFIVVLVAFFLFGALFVRVCDSIIGSDEEAFAEGVPEGLEPEPSEEQLAA